MEIALTLDPPPFVGQPPQEQGDVSNVGGRALLNFFGGPPKDSDEPSAILGNPGSRGSISGTARVAGSLDEATHLRPGEILVREDDDAAVDATVRDRRRGGHGDRGIAEPLRNRGAGIRNTGGRSWVPSARLSGSQQDSRSPWMGHGAS